MGSLLSAETISKRNRKLNTVPFALVAARLGLMASVKGWLVLPLAAAATHFVAVAARGLPEDRDRDPDHQNTMGGFGFGFSTGPQGDSLSVLLHGKEGDGGDGDARRSDYADKDPKELYPNRQTPPQGYKDGPLPHISDALFSLIILVYVTVIFLFMFFSFCWKEPKPPPPDPAHKNIPMITSMLEEMEKQEQEAAAAAAAAASAATEAEDTSKDVKGGEGGEEGGGERETHELQEKPLISSGGGGGGGVKVVRLPPIEKVVHVNVENKPGVEEEPAETATQV